MTKLEQLARALFIDTTKRGYPCEGANWEKLWERQEYKEDYLRDVRAVLEELMHMTPGMLGAMSRLNHPSDAELFNAAINHILSEGG